MRLAALLTLLFSTHFALAQNTIGLPLILNYSKTDFGGGSQTWDIIQDSSGRMYFANNEGLLSFDGTYWKIYPLPNRTILRSIAYDNKNRVFVGGQGEIGYFETDPNGFLKYRSLLDQLPPNQRLFADVWDTEVLNGSVYFRANDRIFEWTNNSFKVYPAAGEWVMLKKSAGRLFAQDKQQGLFELIKKRWQPLVNSRLLVGKSIQGIVGRHRDSLLLVTYENEFYSISGDRVDLNKGVWKAPVKSDIYSVQQLNDQHFVLGTTSEGCVVLDFQGNVVQKISRKEGLQNNSVLCVYLDRDKNLWTGLNNGISFIGYNSAIKFIRPDKENELSGFSARILNNRLFVASSDGLFMVPLMTANPDLSFSRGDFEKIPGTSGQAWRLDEVNQQLLMAHNSGTYSIKGNSARMIAAQASWLFMPTSEVLPSRDVLVGTYTGIRMLDYNEGRFIDRGNLDGTYESFRFLDIDNEGRIWSSHPYRGIYQIQLSPDKKTYVTRLYTEKDGLPSALGNHVFKVRNRVIFATERGAYEYDGKTQRFIPSPFLTPLLGSIELRYLNEDAEGNIWFCSGKKLGVVQLTMNDNDTVSQITYFPELTGQVLSGFENVYPFDRNNIFIGSEKGIIHLNLEKYVANNFTLLPQIGEIRATGASDTLLYGGYVGGQHSEEDAIAELAYRFNSFHFEYSCPAYGLQSNVEYSYKLEGFDNEWSSWSGRTEKNYTNLPNGKYTFLIKARTNLSSESKPVAYSFVVLPPWYKSKWAIILYAVLGLLLAYFFDRWHRRKLELQRLQYEEQQRQINIAHQLEIEKNEKEIIKLQNEKLASEVLFKNKELADTSLHLVERTDALAKVKEELQKLYKSQPDKYSLKKTIQFLNEIERNNDNWDKFAAHFDEINNNFLRNLKLNYPQLSSTDLKICAYLQLNLSSKEIAQLINISLRGVEIRRYRLRKKLQIPTEQSLIDFLNTAVEPNS